MIGNILLKRIRKRPGISLIPFFLILFLCLNSGCQGNVEEGSLDDFPSPPPEDLNGYSLFLLQKGELVIFRLEDDQLVKKIPVTKKISKGEFSSEGESFYLFGKNSILPFNLLEGKFLKEREVKIIPWLLKTNPHREEIFNISQAGTLSVFYLSGNEKSDRTEEIRSIFIDSKPKLFHQSPDTLSLYVATDEAILLVNWQEGKILQKKETSHPVNFLMSPYGSKIYWLGEREVIVFEKETLKILKTIPIKGVPIGLRITPAGNKLFILFENAIWVVRTSIQRVETKIPVKGILQDFIISPDGSFAFAPVESSEGGTQLLLLDLGLDRVITTLPLPQSTHPIRNSEFGITKMAYTPGGSRLYILSDSLYRVDIAEKKVHSIYPAAEGQSIRINPIPVFPVSREKVRIVDKPSVEREVFTIQVSSHLDKKGAEFELLRLRSHGYPAYQVTTTTPDGIWYRIRVGGFTNRDDGEVLAEKIGGILGRHLWVTRARIDPSILPKIPLSGRDLDRDGKREEAVILENRRFLLFTLEGGFFHKVFEVTKREEFYSGKPQFRDVNKDGTPEIVTTLLQEDKLSIIDWDEKGFSERLQNIE
jgi:hypothetical protein